MKWSFVIQQKLKAAFLLGGVMVVVILGNLLSRNQLEGIDKSFSSIYQDRLVPATTFTYLVENLYGKRLSLEKFLLSQEEQSSDRMVRQLQAYDKSIDSLIAAFEKHIWLKMRRKVSQRLRTGYRNMCFWRKWS